MPFPLLSIPPSYRSINKTYNAQKIPFPFHTCSRLRTSPRLRPFFFNLLGVFSRLVSLWTQGVRTA